MPQLDGSDDHFWEQTFSIKAYENPHRRELYYSFIDRAKAASNHAFFLARFKEKFHTWSIAASSVVDIQVLLVAMEMAWNREDHPSSDLDSLHKTRDRAEKKLRDQVCWETFTKAYACHHPSSPPLSTISPILSVTMKATPSLTSTSSVSTSSSKPVSYATQLAHSLPAHHPPTTLETRKLQERPIYHSQGVQTGSLKDKKVPAHHQKGAQTISKPSSAVSAPISPSPPTPVKSTTLPASSSTSPTLPTSFPSWRGPRPSLFPRPAPSPCPKCGSWARSHPPSRCKRRQRRAGLSERNMKGHVEGETTYSLSVVMEALRVVEDFRRIFLSPSFFPHQPFFSFGGGGNWDPGMNFGRAHGRVPR